MARNIEDIERDIERTRRQLAGTLDELSVRSQPQNLANNAKSAATDKLQDEKVQKILAGVAIAVVGGIAFTIFRNRRRSNDIKELKRILATRK